MQRHITILDSTLRDGAQGEGISFSVEDKIGIVRALDELGIAYLEAGNPASNPKELEFFDRAAALPLKKRNAGCLWEHLPQGLHPRRGCKLPGASSGKHAGGFNFRKMLGAPCAGNPENDAGGKPAHDRGDLPFLQRTRKNGYF